MYFGKQASVFNMELVLLLYFANLRKFLLSSFFIIIGTNSWWVISLHRQLLSSLKSFAKGAPLLGLTMSCWLKINRRGILEGVPINTSLKVPIIVYDRVRSKAAVSEEARFLG